MKGERKKEGGQVKKGARVDQMSPHSCSALRMELLGIGDASPLVRTENSKCLLRLLTFEICGDGQENFMCGFIPMEKSSF